MASKQRDMEILKLLESKEYISVEEITKTIEEPIVEEEKSTTFMNKIGSGVKQVAGKVALVALKGKISGLVNEIIEYVGFEAFRVFSKENKEFLSPIINSQNEDVKEATNAWFFNLFY